VLFSGEPFLLGSCSHLTVHNESRSSIVIVGGDAEDSHDIFRLVVATLCQLVKSGWLTLVNVSLRPKTRSRPWATQSERIKADDFENKSNGRHNQEENNTKKNSGKNPSGAPHRISLISDLSLEEELKISDRE
jgi:hypothetical protein